MIDAKARNLRVMPGIFLSPPTLAQTKETPDGFVIGMGAGVSEKNVVKVLNHEMLHVMFLGDPTMLDASEALDSCFLKGVEHVYTRYDPVGLPTEWWAEE
ncbi:MAG TPA: hypothetical protein VEO20_02715 [Thermoplasmata archaeon]|nr:hypothetical protein [Thermoplasmata archaeon]